jgi:hypothetical protein
MWAALALGFFGIVIFAQDPASGVPFLLGAACFGWRARARLAVAASGAARTTAGLTARSPAALTAALSRMDFSGAAMTRAALLLAAAILAVVAMALATLAFDELTSLRRGLRPGSMAAGAALVAVYGVGCILRFRAALQPQALPRQLLEGAVRFACGGFGFMLGLATIAMIAEAATDHDLRGRLAVFAVALPAFCVATGGAIAFAHRARFAMWLPSSPVVRAALLAQTGGGFAGAMLVFGTAAVKADLLNDLAKLLSFLAAGVACGLIAFASAANARSDAPAFRRAALGYGSVLLMLLGVQVPIMWADAFAMGDRLIEAWSILTLIMPIVFLASTTLSFWVLALASGLYRKALR